MRIHANQLKTRCKVHDLDTGRDLREVVWVDCEAGTAEAFKVGADGMRVTEPHPVTGQPSLVRVLLKGRFKLVAVEDQPGPDPFRAMQAAARCARCPSTLVLRGDELCAVCRAAEQNRRIDLRECGPLDMCKCQACSRDATHSVADEVQVSPAQGRVRGQLRMRNGVYLFDRAATVGRRYFCRRCLSKHHEGCRLVDHKGEVIATEEMQA